MAHEGNPVLPLLTIAPCGGVLKGDTTGCLEVLSMDFSLIDYLDGDAVPVHGSTVTNAQQSARPNDGRGRRSLKNGRGQLSVRRPRFLHAFPPRKWPTFRVGHNRSSYNDAVPA